MYIIKQEFAKLNNSIKELEIKIKEAKIEAENNIEPLKLELSEVKKDKSKFASKNDFESVQNCIHKENNLKFKINAQWNKYSLLKEELTKLNHKKINLEKQLKLEHDKIKRKEEILTQMNLVLKNYRKTQNLKQASIDSNINPDYTNQWLEWGKNDFNEIYSYFYTKIQEIDTYFKDLESLKLKNQMGHVIEAFRKTDSLKDASKIAKVSYDTVQYWYEWGSKGFGEENTYFYNNIKRIKLS